MIHVEGLTKQFGDFVAVDDVSFKVAEGEILGFLGPNGAGKTTTMRMLTGYMPATNGTASIDGHDIHRDADKVRGVIGYLPEHPPLYEDLKLLDYLDFVARIKGLSGKARREAVRAIIPKCGLTEVADRVIKNLSKGYKQRIGLAQALVHDPKVLILDEPTIGLDPGQIIEIRQMISDLRGNRTVILSSHILPEVTQICDRVVIIRRGKVVADDTPDNLARMMDQPDRLSVSLSTTEGAAEAIKGLAGVREVTAVEGHKNTLSVSLEPNTEVTADLASLALKNNWGLREIRQERVTLEEIYIRLTSQ